MSLKDKKILIVDDEPISLKIMADYLEGSTELTLEKAQNGKEALTKLEKNPSDYAVLVIDRIMPFMSGLELIQIMQKSKKLKDIPVIMLTGMGEKADIIDAVEAGVFDYLTKPVEKKLLVDLVHRALVVYEKSHTSSSSH